MATDSRENRRKELLSCDKNQLIDIILKHEFPTESKTIEKQVEIEEKKENTTHDEEKKECIMIDQDEKTEMKEIQQLLKLISNEDLLNNAKGLCIGAAIGDSIGSYCEFSTNEIPEQQMSEAMKMAGGGPHKIVSGQITDDTELAICLAKALIKMCEKNMFDSHPIAIEYNKWLRSHPFDVGKCTNNTLFYAPSVLKMKHAAANYNKQCIMMFKNEGNLSNGSLMRCMPLVLYGHKLSTNNFYKLMAEESSLSHANEIVYILNTMYAIGVRYLLLTTNKSHKGRNLNAIEIMLSYLQFMAKRNMNKSAQTILDWYDEMDKENKLQDATKRIAFIKIAFQRIFVHLKDPTTFEKVIYSVIKEGGDTDTNACIVGGVLGAYFGFENIPKQYVSIVLNCKVQQNQYMSDRSEFQAKYYITDDIINILIKKAPSNNEFKMKMYNIDNNEELNKIQYVICPQCDLTRDKNDGAEDDNDHMWYCLLCWQRYEDSRH